MAKIDLSDNIHSAILKMSDGNFGAVNALTELATKTQEIDPENGLGPFGNLINLDSFEIYGTDIYILFNDKCGCDIRKMCLILRATQLGFFPVAKLKEVCSDQSRSINISDEEFLGIEKEALERLPDFQKG